MPASRDNAMIAHLQHRGCPLFASREREYSNQQPAPVTSPPGSPKDARSRCVGQGRRPCLTRGLRRRRKRGMAKALGGPPRWAPADNAENNVKPGQRV